ncbi:MAG: hypothetical protein NTZ09_07370, partial [Candidatus Hydrogenedentes bacterium]|nr:hypothetical protein [Candidatus Hydrogenedentota bacterium]
SLPVEISELPEYAVRVILSAVEALRGRGVEKPFQHLLVFRSEWMARILVSKSPFRQSDIDIARDFCDKRSFDLSYFPGMTDETARETEVWNDLPHFILEPEPGDPAQAESGDAIRDHVLALAQGKRLNYPCEGSFELTAVTNSRPFLNYIIRPASIVRAVKRMDYLPQGEIGLLINYAVFVQALVMAALVACIPFARFSKGPLPAATVGKATVYFAAIGVAYLLVEVMLIERFAAVFQDAVTTFSVVLSSLLIWSGLGSWFVGRWATPERRVVLLTSATLVLAGLFLTILWDQTLVILGMLPLPARCAMLALGLCPLGLGMGMPAGFNFVVWVALALYLLAWGTFPKSDSRSNPEGAGL